MTSPLLSLPGAVAGSDPDAGVAWHYGDPMGEQRAAVESATWTDRSHRDVITVGGPDRLGWLHTLLTQHLQDLQPGTSTQALLLDPHGRVEEHVQIVDDGERSWLDTEPGRGPILLDYLQRMIFWSKVEVEAAPVAVLSVVGPDSAAVLAAAQVTAAATRVTDWPAGGGTDLVVPLSGVELAAAKLSAAGARPMGTWGFEALRVAAGVPRLGCETDHKTIPHEVGWIGPAVHLQKGCYRGQETVARVQNLGRPPRRLVLLHLDGSDVLLPAHGEDVLAATDPASIDPASIDPAATARPLGWVGTAARHYELGPIALAIVKRQVADDAQLVVRAGDRLVAAAIESRVSTD